MGSRFRGDDGYIVAITSTASNGSYNVIVDDTTDFTVWFSEELKADSCTVEELKDPKTEIFSQTQDVVPVTPSYYVDDPRIKIDQTRFRWRFFRSENSTAEDQPLQDNPEVGRNRSYVFKLTYTTSDDVEHEYKFTVLYEPTHSDYYYKELDEDDVLNDYNL
jgi:hypothetical protein